MLRWVYLLAATYVAGEIESLTTTIRSRLNYAMHLCFLRLVQTMQLALWVVMTSTYDECGSAHLDT